MQPSTNFCKILNASSCQKFRHFRFVLPKEYIRCISKVLGSFLACSFPLSRGRELQQHNLQIIRKKTSSRLGCETRILAIPCSEHVGNTSILKG